MDVVISLVSQIQTLLHALPGDAWVSVAAVIGLSGFQEKIKNWFELESPRVQVCITSSFALAGALVPAFLGWMSDNPGVMAGHAALFFTGMTLAYRYVIQPGNAKLSSWKADYAEVKAYQARKAAPAVVAPEVAAPAEAVTSPAPVVATEFEG